MSVNLTATMNPETTAISDVDLDLHSANGLNIHRDSNQQQSIADNGIKDIEKHFKNYSICLISFI